jgi:drug/metabolite transporter (DMT)-like permease
MVFGLILIAVGVIAILVKTGVVTGSIWDYTWPTILVIIGLSFLLGRLRLRRWWWGWNPPWRDVRDRDRPDKQ